MVEVFNLRLFLTLTLVTLLGFLFMDKKLKFKLKIVLKNVNHVKILIPISVHLVVLLSLEELLLIVNIKNLFIFILAIK